MRKVKITGLLLLLLCLVTTVQAQRTTSLRINEVLVVNQDNFVDDYGQRHPWIEIYNSSAGTVNIGGCFLTNDLNQPRMYPIPKGDVLTKIPPRQHVLFWADGQPSHGTFHLSFLLDQTGPNFLALFDSDGTTLIDSVTVPAGQRADISYGLVRDGWNQKKLSYELETNTLFDGGTALWIYYDKVTPSSNNYILDKNPKIDNFKENDSKGLGMTATAMSVVFLGLIVLYLFFKMTGKIAVNLSHRRMMKVSGLSKEEAKDRSSESSAVYAAIAMAIYEATEAHDVENTILTIKQTTRNYSPWSSKIYTLRETPTIKKK